MDHESKTYLTVRYAETDMMGVVHHSRYYPWFEQARTDFIKSSGISYGQMEKMGLMQPVVESECKYLHHATYEDEVVVTCRLVSMSVARCEFDYSVYRLPDNLLLVTGHTVHGFVNTKTFKPVNLKKSYPEIWDNLRNMMYTGE